VDRVHVVEEGGAATGGAPGDGRLVVLVHGVLDRGASFARTARRLRDEGVRTVRYDRRGYGRSQRLGPGTIDDHVTDLLGVLDGRPATLVGHSYGGVLALAAAQAAPSLVRSVLAYEAPMAWVPWWPRTSAGSETMARHRADGDADPGDAAEAFMRRMIGDERWERLPVATRRVRRAEGPALLAELESMRRPEPPYVAEAIGCPVVGGCGSRSSAHHRRAAVELATAVPHGRLDVIEGADHGVHLTHAGEFARRILTVVTGTAGDDGRNSGRTAV
jgi:pimeloyl-ACP methyl ester carboxylesterase